ncbi:MAG: hypothetical protein ACYC6Y_19395, partial [Thermoguttaceae bacterium]
MRRFILERLRNSILRPSVPATFTSRRLRQRNLVCETLEDRHLLSGVTLVTHGAQAPGDNALLPVWVGRMTEDVAVRIA